MSGRDRDTKPDHESLVPEGVSHDLRTERAVQKGMFATVGSRKAHQEKGAHTAPNLHHPSQEPQLKVRRFRVDGLDFSAPGLIIQSSCRFSVLPVPSLSDVHIPERVSLA